MKSYTKVLFEIKEEFLKTFLIRTTFIFLIILLFGINFTIFQFYGDFISFILPVLIVLTMAYALVLIVFNKNNIKNDYLMNRFSYWIIAGILIFCIFNSAFFFESKIEGGHDQGVYLEAAASLAETGSTLFEDQIVLSYPGFLLNQNNDIIHKFSPGYIIYLSMFYNFFGLFGFSIGNTVLLFSSCSAMYLLGELFRGKKTGLLFVLFFTFNYYTLYFSRATYVENLQLLLVWFAIYLFIEGYKKEKFDYMICSIFPFTLLTLVRPEGFIYLFVPFILVCYFRFIKKWKSDKPLTTGIITIIGLIILIDFILYNYIFNNSIIVNQILGYSLNVASNPTDTIVTNAPYNEQIFIWTYFLQVFIPILLPIMFFLGLTNYIYEDSEMKKYIIMITILISPQFIFLIKPSIAFYLPWFMRRFWAVFLPYIILLFCLSVTNKRNILSKHSKYVSLIVVLVMFIATFSQSAPILIFSDGKGMVNFQKDISSNFEKNDLVIFWDRYEYENTAPPLYFLYGTNVVFDRSPAFGPEIYAHFMESYPDVYIITSRAPNQSLGHPYFQDHTIFKKTVSSENLKFLGVGCDVRRYIVYPETFKGYWQIEELCDENNPPNKIHNSHYVVYIYKVDDEFKKQFVSEHYSPTYKIPRNASNFWH